MLHKSLVLAIDNCYNTCPQSSWRERVDDEVFFFSAPACRNMGPFIISRCVWRLMSWAMFCFLSVIELFLVWAVNPSTCYFIFAIGLFTFRCASMNIKYAYELFSNARKRWRCRFNVLRSQKPGNPRLRLHRARNCPSDAIWDSHNWHRLTWSRQQTIWLTPHRQVRARPHKKLGWTPMSMPESEAQPQSQKGPPQTPENAHLQHRQRRLYTKWCVRTFTGAFLLFWGSKDSVLRVGEMYGPG